jgi:hypothetical protein
VIGGYTPGNPFDSLIVGHYEGERLLYSAKVRNGFVPQLGVRWRADSRARRLRLAHLLTCPSGNVPQWVLTKEEMKNYVWLTPELVAQIVHRVDAG